MTATTLAEICIRHQLETKWLFAPSFQIGHQWTETLVRSGQPYINLLPTTTIRFALLCGGDRLAERGLTIVPKNLGPQLIHAAWQQIDSKYFTEISATGGIAAQLFESILAIRLADCAADQLSPGRFECEAKGEDLTALLHAYKRTLESHGLADDADLYHQAIASLRERPNTLERAWLLVPHSMRATGLAGQLVDALPAERKFLIADPADRSEPSKRTTSKARQIVWPTQVDGSSSQDADQEIEFFRAGGYSNEVREVFRRCLAGSHRLDDVEIIHTDSASYPPLIYQIAQCLKDEHWSSGAPVTFSEGIPTSLTAPGRALTAWLNWMDEGCPPRLLIEMLAAGWLEIGDKNLGGAYLAKLLRPLAIGSAKDYAPRLNEQIRSLKHQIEEHPSDDEQSAARERRLSGLEALRRLVRRLLRDEAPVGDPTFTTQLQAARRFLAESVRATNELAHVAKATLIEQIENQLAWVDRLQVGLNSHKWLNNLPFATRVLRSGPRPGCIHVSHYTDGGNSGRSKTFIVGMDDRRFPGVALQDPVLLDEERVRINAELTTSNEGVRRRIDHFAQLFSRVEGSLTISWSSINVADNRDRFPSSHLLDIFRRSSGRGDADLETLYAAVGPPVAFAPGSPERSLNESEYWLALLHQFRGRGGELTSMVDARYPHLAAGRRTHQRRLTEFGSASGFVPQAGADLNPFADDSPALSASALETAGRCPLAYFFRRGLALYAPEEWEIDPDRWLDAAQFGSLMHEVFRRFMDELSAAGRRPSFQQNHRRLAAILGDEVQRWRTRIPPPNESAFRTQSWQMVRAAGVFLRDEEVASATTMPRFFELALGVGDMPPPPGQAEPIRIRIVPGKSISARGQIDRVDQVDDHNYVIWDYKIGSAYGYAAGKPFQKGRRVQSIMYMRMIEAALRKHLDADAVVTRFGYFFPSIRAHGLRIVWDAEELADGGRVLDALCDTIANGAFVATNELGDCTYCDYRDICGNVYQITSRSKQWLKRDDLQSLRPFRELRNG